MIAGRFVQDRVPEWSAYADREGIALVGNGTWRTTACPIHVGSDSLRANIKTGGWVCMACGAKGGDTLAFHQQVHGLGFMEAAHALGAVDETGEPGRPQRPRTLAARDALDLLAADALLIYVAAVNVSKRIDLTKKDLDDLAAAARRILLVHEEHCS